MKTLKFVSIILTLCVLSSFLTFCLTNTFLINKPIAPANKKEKAEDLYSSALTLSQIYTKCGHTIASSTTETITYSSPEELKNRFPGYEITSGSDNQIVLSAKINNFCPSHYKALLESNEITITRLADNQKITSIKILPHSLSSEEKDRLEQGIPIDSQKALCSFIEDFTS